MRIGNRLGGSVFWSLAMTMGATAGASAGERSRTVPLGGTLDGQTGDHYFGVYVPTRFGGELTIKATSGKVVESQGPDGAAVGNGQEVGVDQQGWYTFKVEGPTKAYTVETTLRPGRPEPQEALELLLLADQGRRDPRALGRRQRPGRHDRTSAATTSWSPRRAATSRPGQDIVLAGPNGMLETQPGLRRRRDLVPQPV